MQRDRTQQGTCVKHNCSDSWLDQLQRIWGQRHWQQHLPKTLTSFTGLLHCSPLLLEKQWKEMKAPSLLMQNQEGVRGKPEAEDPWFVKQEKCGYEQEFSVWCQWGSKDCLLALWRRLLYHEAYHDADKSIEELVIHQGTRQILNTSALSQGMTARELRFIPQPCGCVIVHTWPSLI